jgi:hypothetical protein
MASRPEPERILTKEELAEFERKLSMLSDPGVGNMYQGAYQDCRYDGKVLPPSAVQRLVAAWRVLRKFRRAGL